MARGLYQSNGKNSTECAQHMQCKAKLDYMTTEHLI